MANDLIGCRKPNVTSIPKAIKKHVKLYLVQKIPCICSFKPFRIKLFIVTIEYTYVKKKVPLPNFPDFEQNLTNVRLEMSGISRDKYHMNEDAKIQSKYLSIKSKQI